MPYSVPSSLTLSQAQAIATGVFAFGSDNGLAPLAAVIYDAGGNVVMACRQDGAGPARLAVAGAKGAGAAGMGVPSAQLFTMFKDNPGFSAAISTATSGAFAAQPGGALILGDDDQVMGAVGVSGDTGDQDDRAAVAGIEAAGLKPAQT
jgi:uncharacterized protein GlcG (DUF336 family)